METDAPRYARRMTSGAEPGAGKAASPVLNGEDEETGRKALRLVLTQRRGGGDQTGHVCLKRPTSRPLRQELIFQESARRAFCPLALRNRGRESARCSVGSAAEHSVF